MPGDTTDAASMGAERAATGRTPAWLLLLHAPRVEAHPRRASKTTRRAGGAGRWG